MKTFRVGYHYEEHGTVTVEADSSVEAEAKVYSHLDEYGLENLGDHETHHRCYFTEAANA